MLLTVAATIFVLGILIFVHELGHFMAAKAVGIGVPRFSIGLGPVTPLSFRRGETEYVLSWIPFGGYVKMASSEEAEGVEALEGGATEQEFPPEKMFESKPLWARILVISAGVIMNALFAWVVYVSLSWANGRTVNPITRVAEIDASNLPPAAAALATVPFGAKIVRLNGDTVASWNDVVAGIQDASSERLRLDFAELDAPIIMPIRGLDMEARAAVMGALSPLLEPRVGIVLDDTPAHAAGLLVGDLIVSLNGDTVRAWPDLVNSVQDLAGQEVQIGVTRDGERLTIAATPRGEDVRNALTGEMETVGRLGIGYVDPTYNVELGFGAAVVEGTRRTVGGAQDILFAFKGLVTAQISPRELGGPVLIGQISGQTARMGLAVYFDFMALFSINLAILNLLPIPVLDGGHLVFLMLEGVRGKPLPMALRMRLTQVGLVLLLGIMALAVTNDFLRLL